MSAHILKKLGIDVSEPKQHVVRRTTVKDLLAENFKEAVEFPLEGFVLLSVDKLDSGKIRARTKGSRNTPTVIPGLTETLQRLLDVAEAAEAALKPSWQGEVVEEDNTELMIFLKTDAMARRVALHAAGDLVDSGVFCEKLSIGRQSLSKAVSHQRLFRVQGVRGANWYPAFFADTSFSRRDLETVSVALGDLQGDAKWHFFTSPKQSLDGKTPLELLQRGQVERVLKTAALYRERTLGR